jgi:hypothetical protein
MIYKNGSADGSGFALEKAQMPQKQLLRRLAA